MFSFIEATGWSWVEDSTKKNTIWKHQWSVIWLRAVWLDGVGFVSKLPVYFSCSLLSRSQDMDI